MSTTLVCLIGNARGSDIAWQSLVDMVLTPLNADLALMFGKKNSCDFLESIAKHNWNFDEPTDWGDIYDKICSEEQIPNTWRESARKTSYEGLWGGVYLADSLQIGSGAIAFILRHMLLQHIDCMKNYDTIIVTRSDHLYLAEHDAFTCPVANSIYVPTGEDWWGITDRHYVFASSEAYNVLDVAKWLMLNHVKVSHDIKRHHNPEQVLKMYYENIGMYNKIVRCKRCMVTVATSYDQTRWKNAIVKVPGYENLFLKYPHEYFSHLPVKLRKRKADNVSLPSRPFDTTGKIFLMKGLRVNNLR